MTVTVIGDNTGDDYSGTEDNQILESIPTTNYGTNTSLEIKNFGTISEEVLLSFSGLSNISATDTVSAATVGLYRQAGNAGTGNTVRFYKLLRNWVETESTWRIWSTGNSWTTYGALSDGNDKSSTTTADMTVDGAGSYYTASSAQLASDVEDFIDGTLSNYGWVLIDVDAPVNDFVRMSSSEHTDGQRPYLSVTHAAGGGGATIPVFINHYRNQGIA